MKWLQSTSPRTSCATSDSSSSRTTSDPSAYTSVALTARQKAYIRSEYQDNTRWDVPVGEFIRAVSLEELKIAGDFEDILLRSASYQGADTDVAQKGAITNKVAPLVRLAASFLAHIDRSGPLHARVCPSPNRGSFSPKATTPTPHPNLMAESWPLMANGKRKRVNADGTDDVPPLKRRLRPTPIPSQQQAIDSETSDTLLPHVMTDAEMQAIVYVNDALSSSVWTFVLGWLVEEDEVRLVYGDRMGLVFTQPFPHPKDVGESRASMVPGIGVVRVGSLGFDEGLNGTIQLEDSFGSEGPAYTKFRLDVLGEDGAATKLEFDVDKDELLCIPSGLLGRGTIVASMTAPSGSEAERKCGSETLVAKVAWPHKGWKAEDQVIRAVRQSLADKKKGRYLDHIVDLKCAVTKSIEEMGLPRVAMGIIPEEQDLRVCRTLILKRYQRLEAIGSAECFHVVFVDVVRAHHWVYETSKILHGDISINNIMWFIKDGQVIGVLCDWDLAEDHSNGDLLSIGPTEAVGASLPPGTSTGEKMAKPSNEPQSQTDAEQVPESTTVPSEGDHMRKPRYRTGTGPFMALDLLREGYPPLRKYRHDLESFFYLYAYAAAGYDPTNNIFRPIKQWQLESLVAIGDQKYKFLTNDVENEAVFSAAHEEFKPLLAPEGFLMQLRWMFRIVERKMDKIKDLKSIARYLGSAEDVEAKICKAERKRDEMATYSEFMSTLGASEDI
ncbi:uncharacterized protein C8Q71DRAFT_318204 [Rhodofomes roseus]|uniref:Fungal-type protein kinase domain-containing protein n=1 Tax=Rhodofomes roseus TaxID=34475 RepID=A0ABQ8K404_9APHY|nr:uncharacterized protein C8Q71DRAFT_318204 [Rhodofomes roseus]KAH9831015.1 hypothetical protein C8Q71DRAFT_318204 [Rhodofomes roseus]